MGMGKRAFGLWFVLGLVTFDTGCEGGHAGDFVAARPALLPGAAGSTNAPGSESSDNEPSGSEPLGSEPPGSKPGGDSGALELLALGGACTDQTACASAHCVDGVCCDSVCTDLCATCAAPGSEGTCSPAPSDTACDAVACPGGTECRGRDQTAVALNCEGIGVCRTNIVCDAIDQPTGTSCREGTGTCNGTGACSVPGKALLGASCATDDECAEGHCAGPQGAAICCDAPCDGICQHCSAAGHCDEKPANDARCEAVTCPSDDPCRSYPDTLTDNLCSGLSQCATAQSCPATALRPGASCDCDAELGCTLRQGIACSTSADCTSGICQSSLSGLTICCVETCGAGLSCAADGSGCVQCEGPAVTCDGSSAVSCVNGQLVPVDCANGCSDGLGCNSEAPVGFPCAAVQCVAGAVCQADVAGTRRCCTRDCGAENKVCAADGSCVCPPGQTQGAGSGCELRQGDPCGTGSATCGAGLTCTDGVCCNDACDGACESCNQPASVGTCTFNSRDTAGCQNGEQCVGRGDCRSGQGRTCAVAPDCVSGNCEPLIGVNGANTCCAANCAGQTPSCTSDGSRCVQCQSNSDCPNGCNVAQGVCNPPRTLGATCSVAAQCGSNVCLPDADDSNRNLCCPRCAVGQLCRAGACADPPAGAGDDCARDNQCGTGLFCRDGVCCRSQCNGACQVCGGGTGTCNVVPATDPGACSVANCGASTECRTVTAPAPSACSALGQCAACQTRNAAVGTDCSADGDCDNQGNCQPNRVRPVVDATSLRVTQGATLDSVNLVFSPASDDRTPPSQLQYAVFHALTDILGGTPEELVAAAAQGGTIRTPRAFAQGSSFSPLTLPQRNRVHFLRVVVKDGSGNLAAYNTASVTFQDPSSCALGSDCLSSVCTPLFVDQDGDRFGTGLRIGGTCSGTATTGFATNNTDCCDLAAGGADFRPNQTGFFDSAVARCAHLGDPQGRDYNCDGVVSLEYPPTMVCLPNRCNIAPVSGACPVPPCITAAAGCGATTDILPGCDFVAEVNPPICVPVSGGPVVQGCR